MPTVYRIMLRCPLTTNVLDTGIRTSGRESLNGDAYGDGRFSCPFCNQFHSLDEDGFFEVDQNQSGDSLWRPNP